MTARTRWWAVLWVGLLLLGLAPQAHGADTELAWDDGERVGKKSAAGTGHVIAFEAPRGTWWLKTVRIHGQRYGGGYDPRETRFTIAVCDHGLQRIASFEAPYARFRSVGFSWVDVELPRAVQLSGRFKITVSFDPSATRGVFVGTAATDRTHSSYGLPCEGETRFEDDEEWMIRAVLSKRPPRGVPKEMILSHENGLKEGHKSLGGSGHVLEMKKPRGTWWIQSVLLYGQRYGGGYDPLRTRFRLAVVDKALKPLHEQDHKYSLFGTKRFAWEEVFLTEPMEAPKRFRIAVDFDPGPTKGVYLGYAKPPRRSSSYTGRVGGIAEPFRDGNWMIRVRLVSEKPPPPPPEARDPSEYLEDFDFLKATVAEHFPALEKKGVDWDAVCKAWRPTFAAAKSDADHVQNARRLLALLGDMHSGVTDTEEEVHVPSFDGLYGAGMWIAAEHDHLVLRTLMPDHPLQAKLGQGARLVRIDGQPARFVHERVRRRLRTWHGWSSTHFLDARLSFQFFPFGEKQTLRARFVNPDGKIVDVDLPRWGPRGKGLSRVAVTMPQDVDATGHAVATKLLPDIGYVRILGGMNETTRAAFYDVLERVKGVKAILLDCRGMGGGGDGPAWAMAGRFFDREIPLRHDPVLKPSGSWQFKGPVVMLTDERMVSSAETFTWAMSETLRAVTLGRPTGGATIIPRTFLVPSRLFHFQLGVEDRKTSTHGVQPEGIGTKPDIPIHYDSVLLQRFKDPILAVGFDVVRMLASGSPRSMVVDTYGGILGAEPYRLGPALAEWRNYPKPENLLLGDLTTDLIDAFVEGLAIQAEAEANPTPDAIGNGARLDALARVARLCGRAEAEKRALEASLVLARERNAQEAFLRLLEEGFPPTEEALDDVLEAHDGTRWAAAARRALK